MKSEKAGSGYGANPKELSLAKFPHTFHRALRHLREPSYSYTSDGLLSEGQTPTLGASFDDLLGEPLGSGHFFNTFGSMGQLAMAIALSPHPNVPSIVEEGGPHMVNELRQRQVLAGMRILDLGCGDIPSFALTAKALGATVHTVDGSDLVERFLVQLDGHSVLNLNRPDVVEKLLNQTGGNFDFVTENIVAQVPGDPPEIFYPGAPAVRRIGEALLSDSGSYFGAADLYQWEETIKPPISDPLGGTLPEQPGPQAVGPGAQGDLDLGKEQQLPLGPGVQALESHPAAGSAGTPDTGQVEPGHDIDPEQLQTGGQGAGPGRGQQLQQGVGAPVVQPDPSGGTLPGLPGHDHIADPDSKVDLEEGREQQVSLGQGAEIPERQQDLRIPPAKHGEPELQASPEIANGQDPRYDSRLEDLNTGPSPTDQADIQPQLSPTIPPPSIH